MNFSSHHPRHYCQRLHPLPIQVIVCPVCSCKFSHKNIYTFIRVPPLDGVTLGGPCPSPVTTLLASTLRHQQPISKAVRNNQHFKLSFLQQN